MNSSLGSSIETVVVQIECRSSARYDTRPWLRRRSVVRSWCIITGDHAFVGAQPFTSQEAISSYYALAFYRTSATLTTHASDPFDDGFFPRE